MIMLPKVKGVPKITIKMLGHLDSNNIPPKIYNKFPKNKPNQRKMKWKLMKSEIYKNPKKVTNISRKTATNGPKWPKIDYCIVSPI